MLKRPIGIVFLVYLIIGVIVAWSRGYLHLSLLKAIGSAILAILLWWLPLLGISRRLHQRNTARGSSPSYGAARRAG